jgi:hypothetical protein
MKGLFVARCSWLVSLFFLAGAFGAFAPQDLVGDFSGLAYLGAALAAVVTMCRVYDRSNVSAYLSALVACYATGALVATAMTLRGMSGVSDVVSVCEGGLLAFLFTALRQVTKTDHRSASQHGTMAAHLIVTVIMAAPLLVMAHGGYWSLCLFGISALCLRNAGNALALTLRCRRLESFSYKTAVRTVTAPLGVFNEWFANSAG